MCQLMCQSVTHQPVGSILSGFSWSHLVLFSYINDTKVTSDLKNIKIYSTHIYINAQYKK